MLKLKTKRLFIIPMTNDEIRSEISREQDDHMKKALREMLKGCLDYPERRLWFTNWRITLHDGTTIGSLCFKGNSNFGEVEIGYGIDEAYRNKGYATEAVLRAAKWAFVDTTVYFVMAETEADNAASQRVIQKLGFVPCGDGLEGPRFEKSRPLPPWTLLYTLFGLLIGCLFGFSKGNPLICISIGICVGIAVGAVLEINEKRTMQRVRNYRKNRR